MENKISCFGTFLVVAIVVLTIFTPFTQSSIPVEETTGTPAGWTDDIRITDHPNSEVNPSIACFENNVHIVWERKLTNNYETFYINSTNAGQNWNNPIQLSSGTSGIYCRNQDVGINNSNIHVIWDDNDAIGREVRYINSTDGGITWNTPKKISGDDGATSTGAKIAVNGSELHVIWVDERHGPDSVPANTELYYNRSLDGGTTWQGEQRLTNALFASAPSGIVVNGSNIHITWIDGRSGGWDVYYKMSPDNGLTWQDGQGNVGLDRLLTTNATDHISSSLAVNGSTIHVAWVDMVWPGPVYYMYYRNSTDNGFSWNPVQLLSGPSPVISNPRVSVLDDEVDVVWADKRDDGTSAEIYYKNSTDGGTTWDSDLRITYNEGNDSWAPKIALTNNKKHIVWYDDRDSNWELYYKRFPDFPVLDTTPPEINHTPVPSANVFYTINITANITDDFVVNKVFLNYTGINGTNYNISMNQWNGNWSYDIPGQDSIGSVDYFILCNDTSGNDNQTIVYQIQINDITDPDINHFPVASANVFDVINITANITDDVAVNLVFLNYTGINGTNYNVSMNKWDGNYSYEIPGQASTGIVEYFIWANDTSNNDNRTITYQVQVYDITDPVINHAPVTSVNISEAINITANVTDDVTVDAVFLNYTGINGTNYNVSMQKWNGNYSYEIPEQNTIGNVQYFIWANDTDGNDNRTIEYSVQINDIIKPEINLVPVVSANVGELIIITANVTDDVGVDKVYLNYTDVAGNNYNVSMSQGSDWSYEITGQDNIGIVSYFIWCNDTSGNDNQTTVYQIQINDVVKPEIEHTPVTSVNVSEIINITATITDDIAVDSVYLNYTGVNDTNYNVSMTKWNGNWSYEIPGQGDVGVVTYFIWCNDTSGNSNQTAIHQIQINEVIIPDTTPPMVFSKSPTGVNVSISTTITITFDEPMNITSVQNAITISPEVQISGYSWNTDNTTLTIRPSGNLSYNTTYNITVGTGTKDVAGNNLASVYSWEFTTEVEEIITNGPDDGGIGEYWWIILIIVIVIIIVIYLYWKTQKEEEPEEEIEEK